MMYISTIIESNIFNKCGKFNTCEISFKQCSCDIKTDNNTSWKKILHLIWVGRKNMCMINNTLNIALQRESS